MQKFGELRLDDVYAVITYYLRHTNEVRDLLRARDEEARALRDKAEDLPKGREMRARLVQRRAERDPSE